MDRSPDLEQPNLEGLKRSRINKQIKRLLYRERIRKMYGKLGRILQRRVGKGLSRIDVSDSSAASPTSGDPQNPKTWNGPWRAITSPTEIAQEVCKINLDQYNQAQHTPFGFGPLADMIGWKGDTSTSLDILNVRLPQTLPPDLLPETIKILQTLADPTTETQGTGVISEEEFIQSYRLSQEGTSSSPSGRHIGHYKAALKDPKLVSLHTNMMSIPFQVGFAPDRWTKVADIMIEKEENNPRCHRLRILALFESDLNHAKRIIIGRRLMHHMKDHRMLPTMQYGSVPGRQCLSAVLKKVLCHDIL